MMVSVKTSDNCHVLPYAILWCNMYASWMRVVEIAGPEAIRCCLLVDDSEVPVYLHPNALSSGRPIYLNN